MTTICVFKDRIYADMLVTMMSKESCERTVSTNRFTKIKLLPKPKTFKSGVTIVGGICAGNVQSFEMYFNYLSESVGLFESEEHLISFFKGLHKLDKLKSKRSTFVVFGYNKDNEVVSYHPTDTEFTSEPFVIGSGTMALNRYLNDKTIELIKDPLVSFGARVLLDDSSGTDYNMWEPKTPNTLQRFSLKDNKNVVEKIKQILVNKMEIGL